MIAKQIAQVNVRMPNRLKDQLEDVAKASGRSVNAEIVHRLDLSLTGASTQAADELTLIKEMHQVSLAMIRKQDEIITGKDKILATVGKYLYDFSKIVPPSSKGREAERLLAIQRFAQALSNGDMSDVLTHLLAIAELQNSPS